MCLTLSSRRHKSLAPYFIGFLHFIYRALAELRCYNDCLACNFHCLLSIYTREWFLTCQDVQRICLASPIRRDFSF